MKPVLDNKKIIIPQPWFPWLGDLALSLKNIRKVIPLDNSTWVERFKFPFLFWGFDLKLRWWTYSSYKCADNKYFIITIGLGFNLVVAGIDFDTINSLVITDQTYFSSEGARYKKNHHGHREKKIRQLVAKESVFFAIYQEKIVGHIYYQRLNGRGIVHAFLMEQGFNLDPLKDRFFWAFVDFCADTHINELFFALEDSLFERWGLEKLEMKKVIPINSIFPTTLKKEFCYYKSLR